METETKFKVGDVVCLKSGSHAMTVEGVLGTGLYVVWQEYSEEAYRGQLLRGSIIADALRMLWLPQHPLLPKASATAGQLKDRCSD